MSQTEFLNIDLDIEANFDLTILVEEIGLEATVMRNDKNRERYFASFETGAIRANEIIAEYKKIIDGLSPEAKLLWNKCSKRSFDIGFESGLEPNSFKIKLSQETISALYELNGEIVVTIYPCM